SIRTVAYEATYNRRRNWRHRQPGMESMQPGRFRQDSILSRASGTPESRTQKSTRADPPGSGRKKPPMSAGSAAGPSMGRLRSQKPAYGPAVPSTDESV